MIEIKCLTPPDTDLAIRVVGTLKPGSNLVQGIPEPSFMRRFLADDSNCLVAALDGGQPVGFALGYVLPRVDGPERMMYLHEIGVMPERQGQGIGKQLMQQILGICRTQNLLKIFLLCDAGNEHARRLYSSVGMAEYEASVLYVSELTSPE